jgi:hypothetical protein
MPRIAAEPFMRVVGEMLDFETEEAPEHEPIDADVTSEATPLAVAGQDPQLETEGCKGDGDERRGSGGEGSIPGRINSE